MSLNLHFINTAASRVELYPTYVVTEEVDMRWRMITLSLFTVRELVGSTNTAPFLISSYASTALFPPKME